MNVKNLPLKFSFLALMVILSAAMVLWWNKIKLGIDLRGGHSLVYEIRTLKQERDKLAADKASLEKQFAKAKADKDEPAEKRLVLELATIQANIEQLAKAQADPADLPQRMIAVLKRRIDPNGLRGTEWTPLGQNQFEVRMPAASKEAEAAKDEFHRLLQDLENGNLEHDKIRRLLDASPAEREKLVEQFAQGNAAQAQRLRDLAAGFDAAQAARAARDAAAKEFKKAAAAYEAGPNPTALKAVNEAQAKLKAADATLAAAEAKDTQLRATALDYGRVNADRLQNDLLAYYDSPREAQASRKEGHKTIVERRKKVFEQRQAELLERFPARKDLLEKVIAAFKTWDDQRGYLDDPTDLERLIAKSGVLEFRIVPYLPDPRVPEDKRATVSAEEFTRYRELLEKEGPDALRKRNSEMIWLPIRAVREEDSFQGLPTAAYAGRDYLLCYNKPGYTLLHEPPPAGWRLTNATPRVDERGLPAVGFSFDSRGSQLFGDLTGAHRPAEVGGVSYPGHHMAVILDDMVYSAPVIRDRITDSGIINGEFTWDEARELAGTLEAGSLPAKLNSKPVAVNSFGPAMGEVNLRLGLQAGYWGFLAVTIFMLLYYRFSGFVAIFALALNIVLLLGSMSLFQAVLTVPGLAGIILTIGMAVDANVLIYERLREEQAKGLPTRMALKNAYERAFSAIFDSNVTTIVSAVILGWVGSEEVRGFAITLGLGVGISMFTSLLVTKWVFQALLNLGFLTKPMGMAKLIGVPNINWMSKRYYFWAFSVATLILGLVALFSQGSRVLGIEFTSGTQAVLKLKDDAMLKTAAGKSVLPDDGVVRELFVAQAGRKGGAGAADMISTTRVETRLSPQRVRNFIARYDKNHDGSVSREEWPAGVASGALAAMDDDKNGVLSRAELEKRLPSNEYQITTVASADAVKQVVLEGFRTSMETRQPSTYKVAQAADLESLGLLVNDGGYVNVTGDVVGKLAPKYPEIQDFRDGLLLVARDVSPALSREELTTRIRDLRNQPDFADQRSTSVRVLGLTRADVPGEEKFSAFLIAVQPQQPAEGSVKAGAADVAEKEWKLLAQAFGRSETGETRNFDAQIAGEMKQRALVAIVLGWVAIIVYLWFRFGKARWGVAAVVCLVHDVTIVTGLVAISDWAARTVLGRSLLIESFKIDLSMIAALLTIIGYSVNDTIVVFDRIRENRGKLTTVTSDTINHAVNQTLSRTLLTGVTTLFVVAIMYVWGGPGMHAFNFALLVGILFGTYSSIAVAAPILLGFKEMLIEKTVGSPAEPASQQPA